MTVTRENLLNALQNLQKDFEQASRDARNIDRNLSSDIDLFSAKCRGISDRLKGGLANNQKNPLALLLKDLDHQLGQTVTKWSTDLEKMKRGFDFRDCFHDSLLIYAYGKVKSGKSSLGNYVAWGTILPDEDFQKQYKERHQSFNPKYVTTEQVDARNGDASGYAQLHQCFRVGETETTSSVQSFTLPGLTWIDSPGLHSVQKVNEDLAKKICRSCRFDPLYDQLVGSCA